MRKLLPLALLLTLAPPAPTQDAPVARHTSPDPHKCKRCAIAYEKAVAYLRKDLPKASFPAKMIMGWLFLADGRFQKDLDQIVKDATQWETKKGTHQHAQNWYPALAGLLLAEVYKFYPTVEIRETLIGLVNWFAAKQERTGGWFKWFEGAYKDRLDYAVKDLGILDCIVFGFLWTVKVLRIPVDDAMLQKADQCLGAILTSNGVSYGTGSKGGDTTGARGGFALLGLDFAAQTQHKLVKTYVKLLPRQIPKMDKGHHVGAFHALGVTLACRRLGPQAYSQLVAEWLDRLIDRQDAGGGLYVGDDGDAGGEKGLLNGNHGSTAAFALMILLQDPKVLVPRKTAK